MEFLCMSIYVGLVTYCFSALELKRIVFDRKVRKTTYSRMEGDQIVSVQKSHPEKVVTYPEICSKGHNSQHTDHCTLTFGNKKTASLVQNVCIENRTVVKESLEKNRNQLICQVADSSWCTMLAVIFQYGYIICM